MPGSGSKTPASMIMAGILQTRQAFIDAWRNGDYYNAAWALAQMASLLPLEAKKSKENPEGIEISNPPTAGDKNAITPDIQMKCRQYVEAHLLQYNGLIPLYVYDYFKKGRTLKRGY